MKKHRTTHSCTSFTVFPVAFFRRQLVLLAAILMVPFLTSAQSWDTVRVVDFSNPSFNPNLSGVQGFNAVGFTLGNNGASGNFNDLCAFTSSFSAQDRIAMRVSLLAGVDYRVSLNGKVNSPGQAVDFWYAPASNPQQVTVLSQSIPLADIDYNDPGATVESSTFAVTADGNYWVVAEHGGVNLPDVFARLDNFMVEALEEAPMPSLSLTDNDGNPITSGIEAEPGTPFMLCLSPDSAPAEDMALELSIDGDGSPHFSDFTALPLTFLAGSTDEVCFELSPSAEAVAGTYTFQLTDGNGEEVMSFGVGVEPPCTSVAGPDWNVCEGVSVQLGTGCLPTPHPMDSVEYCYAWEPTDGLDDPASAMPNATPSETTTYTVYVTTSEGELIPEESVVVTVEDFVAEILPAAPSLCYREPITLRQGSMTNACENDFVTLSLSGSYASAIWSTGSTADSITVFDPGLYAVTVTSANGCEAVDEVEVEMCTATPLDITASIPQLCEDTVTLSVDTAFMSYTWSDGSGLSALQVVDTGTYSVTVEDVNGCMGVDSITIGACNPLVDIDIYNGFYDWVSNTSWSGGQKVPDGLEYIRGAVTVANLNDTDGDSIPDFQDQMVLASNLGRNEVDLMRLVVFKPQPYLSSSSERLKLTIVQGGEIVKLWDQPDKSNEVMPSGVNEYEIDFSLGLDSMICFVEALDHSSTINDIVITASYKNSRDTISATSVWVDTARVWLERFPGVDPALNPDPIADLPNLTNHFLIRVNQSVDQSRYGHGTFRKNTSVFPNTDNKIGGRVLLEFTVNPPGLNQLVDNNGMRIVRFDLTRRRENRSRGMLAEEGGFIPLFNNPSSSIVDFPLQNELANDDGSSTEENREPINNTVYGWDAPGVFRNLNIPYDFVYRRSTFEEFARIQLFSMPNDTANNNLILGSRASKKWEWNNIEYYKLINVNGLTLDYDLDSVSYSYPRFSGNGNGNINVSLLSSPITKAYTVEYTASSNQWTLSSIQNMSVINQVTTGSTGNNTWQMDLDDEVQITISQGSTPFSTGDKFSFSVFNEPNGKLNQIKLGSFNVIP